MAGLLRVPSGSGQDSTSPVPPFSPSSLVPVSISFGRPSLPFPPLEKIDASHRPAPDPSFLACSKPLELRICSEGVAGPDAPAAGAGTVYEVSPVDAVRASPSSSSCVNPTEALGESVAEAGFGRIPSQVVPLPNASVPPSVAPFSSSGSRVNQILPPSWVPLNPDVLASWATIVCKHDEAEGACTWSSTFGQDEMSAREWLLLVLLLV